MPVLSILLFFCAAFGGISVTAACIRSAYGATDATTRGLSYALAFAVAVCALVTAVVGVVLW